MRPHFTKSLCIGLTIGLLPLGASAQAVLSLPAHPPVSSIQATEYFFDNDPGYGNGTPLPLTPASDVTISPGIDISQLPRGPHRLYVRVKDGNGRWSNPAAQIFTTYKYLDALPAAAGTVPDIIAGEYFIDTDPGAGNGAPIVLTPGTDVTAANIAVGTGGLSTGVHYLYVRVKDTAGRWSLTGNAKFTFVINTLNNLPAHQPGKAISKLEYFIDSDPGFGQGTQLTVPATTDLNSYTFAADITGLPAGPHVLYARTVDGPSMTVAQPFQLGNTNPLPVKWISLAAQLDGDTALVDWRTGSEKNADQYIVARSADGRDFRPLGSVNAGDAAAAEHSYQFKDGKIPGGTSYYRVGLRELDGSVSWSPVVSLRKAAKPAAVRINNPVTQTLQITWQQRPALSNDLTILDATGNTVLRIRCEGSQEQHVDLGALPAGMYLLRCLTDDGITILKFTRS